LVGGHDRPHGALPQARPAPRPLQAGRHPGRPVGDAGVSDLRSGLDKNLIDGKLVASASGATFETLNPATEEVLGVAADGTAADMDRAIGAARRAFDDDVE